MPVKISKLKSGKYRVSTPNKVHARHTTRHNAKAQARLLRAVDHGWKPTHKQVKESASWIVTHLLEDEQ